MDFFIKPDGHRQAGFSLIEVLITAGVLSILSLAMANLTAQQRKSTAYLERQLAKVDLIRNIETILQDGPNCQKTLETITMPAVDASVDVASIKDSSGAEIYESSEIYNRLKLEKIEVINRTVVSASSTGFVDMLVHIKLEESAEGPKALYPGVFRLSVTVDGSNIVSGCSQTNFGLVEDFECSSMTSSSLDCTVQSDVDTKFCAIKSSLKPTSSLNECGPRSYCEVEDPDSQGRWQLKVYSEARIPPGGSPVPSDCTCKMICIK